MATYRIDMKTLLELSRRTATKKFPSVRFVSLEGDKLTLRSDIPPKKLQIILAFIFSNNIGSVMEEVKYESTPRSRAW